MANDDDNHVGGLTTRLWGQKVLVRPGNVTLLGDRTLLGQDCAPANATCRSRTTSTAGPGLPSLLLYTEEGGPRQRVAYPQAQLAALREPRCSPEFELIAAACRRRLRSDTQAEFESNSLRTVKIRLELQKRP